MDLKIDNFLRRETQTLGGKYYFCSKCIFVVPTYEVDIKDPKEAPANKDQLRELIKVQNIRFSFEFLNCKNIQYYYESMSRLEKHNLST